MKLSVNLSVAQHSEFGKVLHKILYSSFMQVLDFNSYSACPHNGGEHSLFITDTKENVISFLELVKDEFKTSTECIDLVLNEINSGSTRIFLKRLMLNNNIYPYIEE